MKSFRLAVVLLLVLVLTLAVACNPFEGGGEEEGAQRLVTVERGDLVISVSGSATFEASRDAELNFSSGGKVEKIYVEEGDEVLAGDVLAKLDTSVLELALLQAEAVRDEVKYNLNQLKHVLRASSDRVKIAELQLEVAERSVSEAQKQLDETVITAPFGGVVVTVGADDGDILPGPTMSLQPVIKLIDLSSLELEVDIDEIDIASIKPGQRAIIEVDALPDLELEGQVAEIYPVPTVEGGVVFYQVTVNLSGLPVSGLRVGMSATADIIIRGRTDVLLIPERAIQLDSEGNPIVKVVVNEEFEERPVVLGITDGFDTEVLSGLEEGEVVVVEIRSKSGGTGGLFGQ